MLNDEDDNVPIPPECICEGELSDEIFSVPIACKDWEVFKLFFCKFKINK
jgi:hypothetical protein